MMCKGSLTEMTMPGEIHYGSPNIVVDMNDEQKFKNFVRVALTVVGRVLFTYEIVDSNPSYVHLQTVIY